MKISSRKRKKQSGASLLESMIALLLMCLIFFGALQLWQWAMAKMFCNYAAFYAGKAYSLGYSVRTINKAARVAAMAISGPDEDRIMHLEKKALETRMRMYMASGNAGVHFPYWDARGRNPNLRVSHPANGTGCITVMLENAPYWSDEIKNFLHLGGRPVNPEGKMQVINHSDGWAE